MSVRSRKTILIWARLERIARSWVSDASLLS